MNNDIEEWRDVPDYKGHYQASSLGRVRSLDRWVTYSNGTKRFYKGVFIEGGVKDGYNKVHISIGGKKRKLNTSQVVAMAFLNHKPNGHALVVDHINGDKSDDRVENLRIVTNRANSTTCFRSDKGSFSSKYVGVHWSKSSSKWNARIQFNGSNINLGYFDEGLYASNAYQSALSKIEDGSFNPDDYKPKYTSQYKRVYFNKASGKWVSHITINGKRKYLGYFPTELEAHNAYKSKLKEIEINE